MDETIIQQALAGGLEEEGKENVFMSELGWAQYLDNEAESSYAMNERPSLAQDGYYTPDAFSNPLDVVGSWFDSVKRVASDPAEATFMTFSNDKSGARAFPTGTNEITSRTIKPKVKDFNPAKRVGVPGFNMFGAPSSKTELDANVPAQKSELGWATFMDQKYQSSYRMDERPSQAQDGYFTPDVFSNPLDVAASWANSVKRVVADPADATFMTMQNDQSGNRAWPAGTNEADSRNWPSKKKAVLDQLEGTDPKQAVDSNPNLSPKSPIDSFLGKLRGE
jgi:hypothetical protein